MGYLSDAYAERDVLRTEVATLRAERDAARAEVARLHCWVAETTGWLDIALDGDGDRQYLAEQVLTRCIRLRNTIRNV